MNNENYEIPENIKSLIDEDFLLLFKEKLDVIYNNKEDLKYELIEGNGAWHSALLDTCFDLKKLEVVGHYENLEWYDSDHFDSLLGEMLAEVIKNYN